MAGGKIHAMNDKTSAQDLRVNPRLFRSEPMQRCQLGECHGACCVFGVWTDQREMEDILAHAALIQPFMPDDLKDPIDWFASYEDEDEFSPSKLVVHTAVETRPEHYGGTACVFCLPDGKCALQVAAVANKLHPWRFKPYYCILHPLDLDEEGRITLDETETMLEEEGSCLRRADHEIPLIETFTEELTYLLGKKGYARLQEIVRQQDNNSQEPD
jgi:hypothetical protein